MKDLTEEMKEQRSDLAPSTSGDLINSSILQRVSETSSTLKNAQCAIATLISAKITKAADSILLRKLKTKRKKPTRTQKSIQGQQ